MKKEKHKDVKKENETPQKNEANTESQASASCDEADKAQKFEAELAELKNQNLRLAADFDNYRKRTEKEKEDIIKYAAERVLVNILPVIDNFERAIKSFNDNKDVNSIINGIELTYKQLMEAFTKIGLTPIETVGQKFNPEFHEAVQRTVSDDYEDETVVEEYQKGYALNGRVIRHSMVIVSVKN